MIDWQIIGLVIAQTIAFALSKWMSEPCECIQHTKWCKKSEKAT